MQGETKVSRLDTEAFHRAFMRQYVLSGPLGANDVFDLTEVKKPDVYRRFASYRFSIRSDDPHGEYLFNECFECLKNGSPKTDQEARVATIFETAAENPECLEFLCLMTTPGASALNQPRIMHSDVPLDITAEEEMKFLCDWIAREVSDPSPLSEEDATAIFGMARLVAQTTLQGLEDPQPMIEFMARFAVAGMSGLDKPKAGVEHSR